MKFRIQVAYKDNITDSWWENFDEDTIIKNELRSPRGSAGIRRPLWKNDYTQWGGEMVEWFNLTLRSTEKPRMFLKAEEVKEK